jgi:hypothetical protein
MATTTFTSLDLYRIGRELDGCYADSAAIVRRGGDHFALIYLNAQIATLENQWLTIGQYIFAGSR